MWQRPVEGIIDILGERLLRAVREHNVRRLCIDSMQGFQLAVDFPDRIRDVFSAIAEELEAQGVTTLYTVESADLFGPRIEVPIGGISSMTHNLILLRHVEMNAHLYRVVSVVKLRDSDYDGAIREFRITDNGIAIADSFSTADQVLSGLARSHRPADSTRKDRPRGGKKSRRRER
jgi:circadian clock protein KaiC